jgi:hypothetical protein
MFFWSHKEIHVALTDREELSLVREVESNRWDALKYDTSREARRRLERKISRFLRESLRADPEGFQRRFVFRSCYGDEAQLIFPVLLNAYSRITRRAFFGPDENDGFLEAIPKDVVCAETADLYQITLLGRGRWPWSSAEVVGRLSFPATAIQKLAGSADNFFAVAETLHMKFHRDYVRISFLDKPLM